MKTRVFLCRHGETNANKSFMIQGQGVNAVLNERGIEQACALKLSLQGMKFDGVFCSRLDRSKETASIVAGTPRVVPGFDEMHYGTLEGKALKDCMPELRRLTSSWVDNEVHVRCPGGESPHDVISRGVAALHECVFESSNASTILIVAHSRFNKILLSYLMGHGTTKVQEIEQHNCCINVIDFSHTDRSASVIATNISDWTNHHLNSKY